MVKYKESERCAHLIGAVLVCVMLFVGGKCACVCEESVAFYVHKGSSNTAGKGSLVGLVEDGNGSRPSFFVGHREKRDKERSRKIPRSLPMTSLQVEAILTSPSSAVQIRKEG